MRTANQTLIVKQNELTHAYQDAARCGAELVAMRKDLRRSEQEADRELDTAIAELCMHEIQFQPANEQFQQGINDTARSVGVVLSCLGYVMRNHLGARLHHPGYEHPAFQGEDLRQKFEQLCNVAPSFFELTRRRLQPIRNFFQF